MSDMILSDSNPFIRFAQQIYHVSEGNRVMVQDCRIFYVLSGKAELFMPRFHYTLVPGSLFYCCAGTFYNLVSDGVECICLNFDLTQEHRSHTAFYSRINVSDADWNREGSADCAASSEDEDFLTSHLFLPDAAFCAEPLNTILEEFSLQLIYYREACSGILKNLLAGMQRRQRQYHNGLLTTQNASTAVGKVLDYIRKHYDQPITNRQLSEITSYHENHLNRLFLSHTGTTIHKCILTIRLNEAKKLLLNTDLALFTIAARTGFNSSAYFSVYFKQAEGISPLEFRKRFRSNP